MVKLFVFLLYILVLGIYVKERIRMSEDLDNDGGES